MDDMSYAAWVVVLQKVGENVRNFVTHGEWMMDDADKGYASGPKEREWLC